MSELHIASDTLTTRKRSLHGAEKPSIGTLKKRIRLSQTGDYDGMRQDISSLGGEKMSEAPVIAEPKAPSQSQPSVNLVPVNYGCTHDNQSTDTGALSTPDMTLSVRQQPVAARACGFGERDRRVIDPPPIVQLHVNDPGMINAGAVLQEILSFLVVDCTLWDAELNSDATMVPDTTQKRQQRRLIGALVSSYFLGNDEHGKAGIFFVFPDLSIRTPGIFSLRFRLVNLNPAKMRPGCRNPARACTISDSFEVYNAKEFVGMRASTALTKALKHQGCLISIKKGNSRTKRDRRDSSKASEEDSNSDEQDCIQPRATKEENNFASSSQGYGKSREEVQSNSSSSSSRIHLSDVESVPSLMGQNDYAVKSDLDSSLETKSQQSIDHSQLSRDQRRNEGVEFVDFLNEISLLRHPHFSFLLVPSKLVPLPKWSDLVKMLIEGLLPCRIQWWPLTPVWRRCSKEGFRVSWQCDCGAELYFDVSYELAKQLQKDLPRASEPDQPVLPLHQPGRSATFHPASSATTTGAHLISPHVPTELITSPESQERTARPIEGTNGDNLSTSDEGYLHWCIDSNASDTLLFPLRLPRLDDVTIIQRLRATYEAVKGFRKWLSLTDIEGVKFVLFKRGPQHNQLQDLIVCLKEDMPPKTDANYRYLSSEPVELLQKFATQTLRHHLQYPHKCNSKDIENIMHLVPKKVNGMLEKKFGAVGWGVQAVPGLAMWKCAVALVLSQVPPMIFAIRWLLWHTGDFQNAFMFSVYLLMLLNFILLVPERWCFSKT